MYQRSKVSCSLGVFSKCLYHCICICCCVCLCHYRCLFLVRSSLLITLTKCFKDHKSPRSLFEDVLSMSWSLSLFLYFFCLCNGSLARLCVASLFQSNRRKFYRLTWQLETADDIFMLMLLRRRTAYNDHI